jgi:hypothetical protein
MVHREKTARGAPLREPVNLPVRQLL